MASATSLSIMETGPADITPSYSKYSASEWANKIHSHIQLIAPHDEAQELPLSVTIDEDIMGAPRRRAANPAAKVLAHEIAALLYPPIPDNPDSALGSIIKYEKDVVKLRRYVILQRKREIEVATQRKEMMNWGKRILKQGPWDPLIDPVSLGGAPSLPMPVTIAEPLTLEPFFDHLRLGGTEQSLSSARGVEDAIEAEEPYYGTKTLEFEKGVVYSDRRMDLCKMVLGPRNIGDLIESLRTNEFITHFLLGNNIIGPHGAKCIAEFLKDYPNRMDTWYLAGNCIDTPSFKILVDEWVQSSAVTNIWLKRNPLQPAAANDVFRLITQTPNLRTLDLDQTELGDVGVAELFSKLAKHEGSITLRHIYLNGVGIGAKGATAIAEFLAVPKCKLDSLYVTNNPIGSDGVVALAAGLKKNKSLTRLTLASVGLTDDGAIALFEALSEHPCLMTLDIGQSYATVDLNSRYNWITDRSTHAIYNFITTSKTLRFLNIAQCPLTHAALNELLRAVTMSPSLLFYHAKTIHEQSKAAAAVMEGQKHIALSKAAHAQLTENVKRVYNMDYDTFFQEEKRWLVNDKDDVRKIDSVYRNRDAGLARRGLKKLDKWWDEDDETLNEVMKGAVGPVCTKRAIPVGAVGPACTVRKTAVKA